MFEKIVGNLGSKADVILSDLAPNVSGLWDIDLARQISLTATAIGLTRQVLRVGGTAVFKVFEGDLLNEFRADLKTSFGRVLLNKPSASRQEMSELYIVCLDFKQ